MLVRADNDPEALALLRRVLRDGRDGDLFRRDMTPDRARRVAHFWLGELQRVDTLPELLRLADDPSLTEEVGLALRKMGPDLAPALRSHLAANTVSRASAPRFNLLCRLLAGQNEIIARMGPDLLPLLIQPETREGAMQLLSDLPIVRRELAGELLFRVSREEAADDRERALEAYCVLNGISPAERIGLIAQVRGTMTLARFRALADGLSRRYPGDVDVWLLRTGLANLPDRSELAWQLLGERRRNRPDLTEQIGRHLDRADGPTRDRARRVLGEAVVPVRACDPSTFAELVSTNPAERNRALSRFLTEKPADLARLPVEQRQKLLATIDDESDAVRFTAVGVVARLPSEEAVPALRKALSDGSARVRYMAAFGLARHGTAAKVAVHELEKATRDEDETVRNRATATLPLVRGEP